MLQMSAAAGASDGDEHHHALEELQLMGAARSTL